MITMFKTSPPSTWKILKHHKTPKALVFLVSRHQLVWCFLVLFGVFWCLKIPDFKSCQRLTTYHTISTYLVLYADM